MNHIEIGGVQHPLLFNFNSIKEIMAVAGISDFKDLALSRDTLVASMDLGLYCAFYGILEAYEERGEQMPFKSARDIGRKIKKFSELLPALDGFTKAITDLSASDEPSEEGK